VRRENSDDSTPQIFEQEHGDHRVVWRKTSKPNKGKEDKMNRKSRSKSLAHIIIVVPFLSLILASPALPAPAPKPKPIVLKALSFNDKNNPGIYPLLWLQDRIKQKSNGRLTINLIGGPEATPIFEQVAAVKGGVVDMCYTFVGAYSGIVPGVETLALSTLTADEERKSGYYDFMLNEHRKAGLFYLGNGVLGGNKINFYIWTNVPVQRPQNLAGKKIGSIGMAADAFIKALGCSHVLMPYPEMYSAMERGVVDGYWMAMVGPASSGWMEVTKYFIDHSFYNNTSVFLVNLNVWNTIPQNLRDLLTQTVLEIGREAPKRYTELAEKERDIMRKAKVQFITFSPADAKWYVDLASRSEWRKLLDKYPQVAPKAKELLSK
jgi:TRAP-type C4-dicarboxylate transport system substrate-binding protein